MNAAAVELRTMVMLTGVVLDHLRQITDIPDVDPAWRTRVTALRESAANSLSESTDERNPGKLADTVRQMTTNAAHILSDAPESLGQPGAQLLSEIEALAASRSRFSQLLGVTTIGPDDPAYKKAGLEDILAATFAPQTPEGPLAHRPMVGYLNAIITTLLRQRAGQQQFVHRWDDIAFPRDFERTPILEGRSPAKWEGVFATSFAQAGLSDEHLSLGDDDEPIGRVRSFRLLTVRQTYQSRRLRKMRAVTADPPIQLIVGRGTATGETDLVGVMRISSSKVEPRRGGPRSRSGTQRRPPDQTPIRASLPR